MLEAKLGVADIGRPQVPCHERLDGGRQHADPDVAAHALLGEVPDRAKTEEVLQLPEAVLDTEQPPVGGDD